MQRCVPVVAPKGKPVPLIMTGRSTTAFMAQMSALKLQNISNVRSPRSCRLSERRGARPRRSGFQALDDVSFTVEHGEFFGLLGRNGAGKTTLISILAGLARATRSTAQVCGYDVASQL